MYNGFVYICYGLENNLCEDFTGKKFCSPLQLHCFEKMIEKNNYIVGQAYSNHLVLLFCIRFRSKSSEVDYSEISYNMR